MFDAFSGTSLLDEGICGSRRMQGTNLGLVIAKADSYVRGCFLDNSAISSPRIVQGGTCSFKVHLPCISFPDLGARIT